MTAPTRSPFRRWLRRILLGLVGLIVATLVVGSVWEWTSRRKARAEYPAPGRLVDIGGRRIHLDCRGTGSPTVVLESGLDTNGSLAWEKVHDSIAAGTRTCAYDRAGVMWSDPKDTPHDGIGVAEDLHAALAAGGETPPLVLVGHSLGGPYIMTYTKKYGDQVAGLVFVDASHPEQVQRLAEVAPATAEQSLLASKVASALRWTGLVRLVMANEEPGNQPADGAARMAAFASTSLPATMAEWDAITRTFEEAGTIRDLGSRPVVVLTAMAPMPDAALATLKMTREQATRFQEVWKQLHDEEASWSTRSRHELVPDATHYIQFDRPDVVIKAVREVVAQVRGDAPAAAADSVR